MINYFFKKPKWNI